MMEEEELITRAERVGILTTAKGSHKMLTVMKQKHAGDVRAILGVEIFDMLTART